MYWTHGGHIRRANMDGSNIETLDIEGYGLALDVVGGKMYWTQWTHASRIRSHIPTCQHGRL